MAPPPGVSHSSGTGDSLTNFERERLERIRQNKERMKLLNLENMMPVVAEQKVQKRPVQRKGLEAKRAKTQEVAPRRRSSRLQGAPADGAEIVAESKGSVVVGTLSGAEKRQLDGGVSVGASQPAERHSKEDLPFESENAEEKDDACILRALNRCGRESPGKAPTKSNLAACALREEDVAKVTKSACTHLAFMPCHKELILAAADKRGNVGIWKVDEEEEGFDGVVQCTPHSQYVSGLAWSSGSGTASLFTASYDGSVRKLDAEKKCFIYEWGDEDMEYSSMALSPSEGDSNILCLGDNQGCLDRIDTRQKKKRIDAAPVLIHNRKVNTVHMDPRAPHLMVTSSTDSTVAVWDMRKFGSPKKTKAVCEGSHRQTCQSAYFAPDGSQRIVSTSFDNTVRIWDAKKGMVDKDTLSIRHDNQTGRWVLPLRAVWAPDSQSILVGSMKRHVDIFNATDGSLNHQLQSEYMTAIAARNCTHPSRSVVASGTASGRIHIYR